MPVCSLDRGGMLEPVLQSDIGDALNEAIGDTVRTGSWKSHSGLD